MMQIPDDLRYHPEHHWARREGDVIAVGITDFAQDALGEVVWVGLPDVGSTVTCDETFCEVESVKTSSDVAAPISGTVLAVNELLATSPELVNEQPYGDGWLARIAPSDTSEWDRLLEPAAYRQLSGADDA